MKNSPNLSRRDHTLINVKLGRLYLFDNYVVAEFKEGVDINFDNFSDITEIIKKEFKDKPFGFISNRLNSYSINLNDATKFNAYFPNLKAYAIVAYNSITQRVFEIENHFFTFNREAFRNLEHAAEWVEKTLFIEA
tara:strand:- start:1753 stop:2160 length:408 start_codon:yes stop_codon:yes gene_type:complete